MVIKMEFKSIIQLELVDAIKKREEKSFLSAGYNYQLGYIRALEMVLSLLENDEEWR